MGEIDYSSWGNERLVPLAINGDASAEAMLVSRNNFLETETVPQAVEVDGEEVVSQVLKYTGRLCKDLLGRDLFGHPDILAEDKVVIADGQIITVNGNPYP